MCDILCCMIMENAVQQDPKGLPVKTKKKAREGNRERKLGFPLLFVPQHPGALGNAEI